MTFEVKTKQDYELSHQQKFVDIYTGLSHPIQLQIRLWDRLREICKHKVVYIAYY